MDKKSWTRILIVIVAGLWAYNIYRTVENYNTKQESHSEQINTSLSFAPMRFNKDTFLLEFPLADPFLRNEGRWNQSANNLGNSNNSINSPGNPRIPPVQPIQAKVEWPVIQYYGFIRNHKADHQLCMLKIADKNYRLSVGDSKNQVTVLQAYSDSISLSFQTQTRTFKK